MSAASFYNSATGQMNVMLATAVNNNNTSVNLYTFDGANITKLGAFALSNLNVNSNDNKPGPGASAAWRAAERHRQRRHNHLGRHATVLPVRDPLEW